MVVYLLRVCAKFSANSGSNLGGHSDSRVNKASHSFVPASRVRGSTKRMCNRTATDLLLTLEPQQVYANMDKQAEA